MEWQPMETAPRDGTMIIVYRPYAERTQDHCIDIKRSTSTNSGCWEATIPEGCKAENYTDGYCYPSHWMPLPSPPKGE